jgi:hypothetical protein
MPGIKSFIYEQVQRRHLFSQAHSQFPCRKSVCPRLDHTKVSCEETRQTLSTLCIMMTPSISGCKINVYFEYAALRIYFIVPNVALMDFSHNANRRCVLRDPVGILVFTSSLSRFHKSTLVRPHVQTGDTLKLIVTTGVLCNQLTGGRWVLVV